MDNHHVNTIIDMNYKLGVRAERERLFAWLKSKGALRESILGDHMLVLYTEQGAIDITRKEFLDVTE